MSFEMHKQLLAAHAVGLLLPPLRGAHIDFVPRNANVDLSQPITTVSLHPLWNFLLNLHMAVHGMFVEIVPAH